MEEHTCVQILCTDPAEGTCVQALEGTCVCGDAVYISLKDTPYFTCVQILCTDPSEGACAQALEGTCVYVDAVHISLKDTPYLMQCKAYKSMTDMFAHIHQVSF